MHEVEPVTVAEGAHEGNDVGRDVATEGQEAFDAEHGVVEVRVPLAVLEAPVVVQLVE